MHDAPMALSSSCDACPATGGGPWVRGVADRGHDAPLGVMASPCKTAARGMVAASLTRAKEWSGVVLIVIVLVGLPRLFAAWFALGQRLTNYLASLVQVNVTGRLEVPIIAAWQQELHEQILPVWVSIWSPTAAAWAWLNLSAGGLLVLLTAILVFLTAPLAICGVATVIQSNAAVAEERAVFARIEQALETLTRLAEERRRQD